MPSTAAAVSAERCTNRVVAFSLVNFSTNKPQTQGILVPFMDKTCATPLRELKISKEYGGQRL